MFNQAIGWVSTLTVILLAAGAMALDVPLRYVEKSQWKEGYFPSGGEGVENKSAEAPPGDWNLPELVSDQPVYALVKMGDEDRLMILDRKNKDDAQYSRIYFDANGNGNLTDDPPVDKSKKNDRSYLTAFDDIVTNVTIDGKALAFRFTPQIYNAYSRRRRVRGADTQPSQEVQNIQLRLETACAWVGRIELDGVAYRVALKDAGVNGRFSDRFDRIKYWDKGRRKMGWPGGDRFYMTTNKKLHFTDEYVLGDYLCVGERLFRVDIRLAESKMVLTPVTEGTTPVKLSMSPRRLSLHTEDKAHCLMAVNPGERIRIPQGRWRLLHYDLEQTDKWGDKWFIAGNASDRTPVFEVTGDRTVKLAFGEPFVSYVDFSQRDVEQVGKGSSNIQLQFMIRGAAEEFVQQLERKSGKKTKIAMSSKNNSLPKEPKYRIVKDDGELVEQGQFEYG